MNALLKGMCVNTLDAGLVQNAIESSGLLSKSQKNILKYIVSFDLSRGVVASDIMDFMSITKQAVNFSLKQLIKRKYVSRYKDRVFVYRIEQVKLLELFEEYKQKQKLKIN